MHKYASFLLAIALLLCLFGCAASDAPAASTTESIPPTTAEPTVESTADTGPSTPLHTDLYVVGVSNKLMFRYFKEIVLSSEYAGNSVTATLVRKWTRPIYYKIEGNATDEDLTTLNKLFEQLNKIEGFPGIHPAEGGNAANLDISFLSPADFKDSFSDSVHGEDAYGAAQSWYYDDSFEVHKGRIGYRTDIPQEERKSVLLEEIVNILGTSDSELRNDSIVYQHSNANTALTEIDWAILKLLYNPMIKCGMNDAACKTVLEQLYY